MPEDELEALLYLCAGLLGIALSLVVGELERISLRRREELVDARGHASRLELRLDQALEHIHEKGETEGADPVA